MTEIAKTTLYRIKDIDGTVWAIHERIDYEDGTKEFRWRKPDGTYSHGDIKRNDLPLFNSHNLNERTTTVVVVEGEKACIALHSLNIPALATVTGADGCPDMKWLRRITKGRRFFMWPDFDAAGLAHMHRVGTALLDAGAVGVVVVDYRPTVESATWASGTDAHDVIEPMKDRPDVARQWISQWMAEWAVPPIRKTAPPKTPQRKRRFAIRVSGGAGNGFGSVSDALNSSYPGINAAPNKNVRCPMHDDRHASLHVLPDDERAYCHQGTCPWSGRGVIASDIVAGARP